MALYRDHGVVLRTYKLGESDRIINVATYGHGKVRAVAKGVRKTKSRFGARLEPISHVSLQFYEGRGDLDIVTQAEIVDHFRPIRDDLVRLTRATALLEVVDQVVQEKEPNPTVYKMLVGALRHLSSTDSPLIVASFFWKLLAVEGLRPEIDMCVSCGSPDHLMGFDLNHGGTLCRDCRGGTAISPDALLIMRMVLGGQLTQALDLPSSPETREVEALANRAMEHHLERGLRALHTLEK